MSKSHLITVCSEEKDDSTENSLKKEREGYASPSNITGLWRVLEHLILRSNLTTAVVNPTKILTTIQHTLENDEIFLLKRDVNSVMTFMFSAQEKVALSSMNNILAYLSYEDNLLTDLV